MSTKKKEPFFMVFVEGGNTPAFKHEMLQGAEQEAKRLAQLTNKKTYVLLPWMSYQYNAIIEEEYNTEILPF